MSGTPKSASFAGQRADGLITIVRDLDELAAAYRPLVTDVGADYVAIQVLSADPEATITSIGDKVLPALCAAAASRSAP